MDPNSVAMMSHFWPILPNDVANGFNNYLDTNVERNDGQDYTERIDHRFNDKCTLMARISYETDTDSFPYLSWGPNPDPNETNAFKETGFNNMLQFTANINPTTINQVTLTQTDDKPRLSITGAAFRNGPDTSDHQSALWATGPTKPIALPTSACGQGWSGTGNGGLPINASDQENVSSDDFTKIKGGHTLQAGIMVDLGHQAPE